jgi:esterase/lipase superfamily enzyme
MGGGGAVGALPPAPAESLDYAVVRTYFGTNRKRIDPASAKVQFGGDRAPLSYGICEVSIPRYHRPGQLESPSIWRLEFREDPAKHVVLMSVGIRSKADYFAQLAQSITRARNRSAFVFVHGYNVSFEDAARRTAQMSYDLGYNGVPVFFSWPSQSAISAYTVDEQNIEWAEAGLKSFLGDLLARSGPAEVILVAHSMGNRGLTRAMAALLAQDPALASKVKEIILAAPDIDAEVFKETIAPALIAAQRPITLYASSKDLALTASKDVHGYPRAGDAGPGLVVIPGIETVDASLVDTSLLGHSYIGDSRTVITDMTALVLQGTRAEKRAGLRMINGSAGRYWSFKP